MQLNVDPVLNGRVDMARAVCTEDPIGWDAPATSGRVELERAHAAIRGCTRCPVLAACMEWRESVPPHQRDGVIAGQIWRDGVRQKEMEEAEVWTEDELEMVLDRSNHRHHLARELGRSVHAIDSIRKRMRKERG